MTKLCFLFSEIQNYNNWNRPSFIGLERKTKTKLLRIDIITEKLFEIRIQYFPLIFVC